jgi:hypothetical protein
VQPGGDALANFSVAEWFLLGIGLMAQASRTVLGSRIWPLLDTLTVSMDGLQTIEVLHFIIIFRGCKKLTY